MNNFVSPIKSDSATLIVIIFLNLFLITLSTRRLKLGLYGSIATTNLTFCAIFNANKPT